MHIFRLLFVCFQTSVYTLGEFHKNMNNSTVFEKLSVSIVDLTVVNIRLTAIPTVKSTIDTSNSSNTVLLFLNYTACRSHFLDRAQLLAQKLLKQGYVSPKLKSSVQTFYRCDHHLVDCYEISISQMTMDLLLSNVISFFSFLYNCKYLLRT